MRAHPQTAWLGPILAIVLHAVHASPVQAFALFPNHSGGTVEQTMQSASRWSTADLADGIQVGVEAGFAADLGATTPEEVTAVREAVVAAFEMWESAVLQFDVTFDAAVVEGPGLGFEIDLLAVAGTHPVFVGTSFFGFTDTTETFAAGRVLTNGQLAPGFETTGADLLVNQDNTALLSAFFMLTEAEQLASLSRLIAHETGHALGAGHSNGNNPFGVLTNYDTDTDPQNEMQLDPAMPFADLIVSPNRDDAAVMSNRPCGEPFVAPCPALFRTTLTPDDRGARYVLYPATAVVPAIHQVSLLVLPLLTTGAWLLHRRSRRSSMA